MVINILKNRNQVIKTFQLINIIQIVPSLTRLIIVE
jgi:hypothetical protein